jgi:hypothetical protein
VFPPSAQLFVVRQRFCWIPATDTDTCQRNTSGRAGWKRLGPVVTMRSRSSAWLNDAAWSDVTRARQSPLFETPIEHFLVRAFLAEPLDEFLAHVTTIEAALGLQSDYDRKTRPKIAKRLGATACVATRVSSLLGAKTDGEDYCRLFDIRSLFLHGRKMEAIPGEVRIAARRLARRVVNGLVKVALSGPALRSREAYLNDLLARGLG